MKLWLAEREDMSDYVMCFVFFVIGYVIGYPLATMFWRWYYTREK